MVGGVTPTVRFGWAGVIAVALLAGCGDPSDRAAVDEQQGQLNGVGIGSSVDAAAKKLGHAKDARAAYPIQPIRDRW